MVNKLNHILIIRLSALGDVAMTVPVIRALTTQYPNLKVTVLTKKSFAPIFKTLENVNTLEAEVYGKHKGVLGFYRLSREIRKMGVDTVADFHNVIRTKILRIFLMDFPFKQIDKGRIEKKELTSGKKFEQLKTTIQRYVNVLQNLGLSVDITNPKFPNRVTLESNIIKDIGSDTKKWIGIAPFAAHRGKMYPLDLIEQVIMDVEQVHKVILFGGGKSEEDILNNLATIYPNVVSVAGKYSLSEELNIISNLDLMLSMDSGNAHLAAMMGIDVITLWGVTHPYAGFYPFDQDIDNALLSDRTKFPKIPTSIYGNKYPDGYEEAMRTIPPSKVIEKIKNILS